MNRAAPLATTPATSRAQRWLAALPLARQLTRQTWRLLSAICLGLTLAVALAGAVPLFSQVAITQGLQRFLAQSPDQTTMRLTGYGNGLSHQNYTAMQSASTKEMDADLNGFLTQPTPYTMITGPNARLQLPQSDGTYTPRPATMTIRGVDLAQYAPFIKVLAGRLPASSSKEIELAITDDNAGILGIPVKHFTPTTLYMKYDGDYSYRIFPIVVVGIIATPTAPAQVWNDNTVTAFLHDSGLADIYGLASSHTLLDATTTPYIGSQLFTPSYSLYWYTTVKPTAFTGTNLTESITRFDAFQSSWINVLSAQGALAPIPMSPLFDPESLLSKYSAHVVSTQIPVILIFLGILGSSVLFASLLADVLVERQTGVIAILRSRGFSRWQIFGAVALQSVVVCAGALVLGGALAVPLARLFVGLQLASGLQGANQTFGGNVLTTLTSIAPYMVAVVVVAFIGLLVAMNAAVRLTVLAVRREATRSSHVPLWQRLNLDVFAIVIAVIGLAVSLYIQYTVIGTNAQTDQLLAPVALLAPTFALLAVGLLFLRGTRILLRLLARAAQRGRGALVMLALTQLERAPRQFIRLSLFLSLALAYTIFALTFSASQSVRAADVSLQLTGADYSGVPVNAVKIFGDPGDAATINGQTTLFNRIPGVTSSSVGFVTSMAAVDTTIQSSFTLIAADARTYAQTAIWPNQDLPEALPQLMAKITSPKGVFPKAIPAIVDAATWNTFHLSPGKVFALKNIDLGINLTFTAVAEAEGIPQTPVGTNGVLVDLAEYSHAAGVVTPLNQIWLRTQDSASAQQSVHTAINTANSPYQLYVNKDRRALFAGLQQEPLTVTLLALLVVGIASPLVLALIATLIAAWQNVRQRLANLALLRALGATPQQLLRMIAWEQGLIYGATLILGAGIGCLFAVAALPNLVFTNTPLSLPAPAGITYPSDVPSVNALYQGQHVPPVRIEFPPTILVAVGILIVVGIISLSIMVAIAGRASLSQSLRLNED